MANVITYTNFIESKKRISEIHARVFDRVKDVCGFASSEDYTTEEAEEVIRNEKIVNDFKSQNPFEVKIFVEGVAEEIGYFPTKEAAVAVADEYAEKGNSSFVVDTSTSYAGTEVYSKYCNEN